MLFKNRNTISGKRIPLNENDDNVYITCSVDLEKVDFPWHAKLYLSGDLVYKLIDAHVNEVENEGGIDLISVDFSKEYQLSPPSNERIKNTYFAPCLLHTILEHHAFRNTNFRYINQEVDILATIRSWVNKEYAVIETIFDSQHSEKYNFKHPVEMTDSEIELMFMRMTHEMKNAVDNLIPLLISGDLLVNADDKIKNDDSGDSAQ